MAHSVVKNAWYFPIVYFEISNIEYPKKLDYPKCDNVKPILLSCSGIVCEQGHHRHCCVVWHSTQNGDCSTTLIAH